MFEEWIKRARFGLSKGAGSPGFMGAERELKEKIREKNRRLEKLRESLRERDREIEELRSLQARATPGPVHASGQSTPVFFLVGRAKSGTSWVMRILNAHPEILCRGEGRIFGRDYKREDIKNMQSKTLQPSSLYRALLDAEYLNAWIERSVWTRDDERDRHLDNLTRVAIDYFLTDNLSRTGKRIVGDKTPFLSEKIVEEIGEIYPEARVIHVIRDGRDVAVSSMHHLWKHSVDLAGHQDLEPEELSKRDAYQENPQAFLDAGESIFTEKRIRSLAGNWAKVVDCAMREGPMLLGGNYAEVRYEDLLERPNEEVGRLLQFLRADAGKKIIERCVESASFERWTKGRQRGQESSTALLRKGVAGDWKSVFTERDRDIFKEEAGELLIKLGYQEAHDW